MNDLVSKYKALGFRLLFWERKGTSPKDWKGPRDKGWNDPNREYDLSLYDPNIHNLGVFTGHEIEPGKFLADVDLDWPEAIGFTRRLLPPTAFGFGRKGKKISHAFYTTNRPVDLSVYTDIADEGDGDGINFLELRGGNSSRMTMIAPSLHSEGTFIELVMDGEIAHCELELLEASCVDIAIACLLIKRVPGGLHHDGRIALSGFLLKQGFSAERVIRIGQEVCSAQAKNFVAEMSAKDVNDMELVVNTTVSRIAGGKKIAGGPKLAEFIGERGKAVVARIRKYLGGKETNQRVLNPDAPMETARQLVEGMFTVDGVPTLHNQTSVYYQWNPPAYRDVDEGTMRSEVWKYLEPAAMFTKGDEPVLVPFNPNLNKVNNVLGGLSAVVNLPASFAPPCWLNSNTTNPLDYIACSNGLLHVPSRTLMPLTPSFFTLNGLNFPYDPDAPKPEHWLKFLNDLWEEDPETLATCQEMFGYLLTPDTRFQKILMLIGPKRSGKSLIGRILGRLIGEQNMCAPSLTSFSSSFGKQPLVGKSLALIADARISGRVDTSTIAETLLAISGEDPQSVERKFLPVWNGKLTTRFVIITNELPKIGDMSGALTSRFIIMLLAKSFYGKEDMSLFDKLEKELVGILNWALEGRDRLYQRNYFVQPAKSEELLQEFSDLSSPSSAFFREAVDGPVTGSFVLMDDLFRLWKQWAAMNGIEHPGTAQNFGKSVRASLAFVNKKQVGGRGEQKRAWTNIKLKQEWADRLESAPPEEM